MSTVSLELANFLNADLSWKRVSKGYRSAPRRARKPLDEMAEKRTRRADDAIVSDSEKLGVAVLGRRFGEKKEHVPVKKRRLLFRTRPSPPQSSSSHLGISETLPVTDANGSDRVGSGKLSEVTGEKRGYTEDFSGIEMLAAVACNNSMGDDPDHADDAGGNLVLEKSTQDRAETSTSAIALEETTAPCERVETFSHEETMDGSCLQENKLENLPCDKDDRTTENVVSLRDERLHWDLNVSMDAWVQPYDADPQKNVVENTSDDGKQNEKLHAFKACEVQRETMDIKYDIEGAVLSAVDGVVSADVDGDVNDPMDSRGFSCGSDGSNGEEHDLQECSGIDRIHDTCGVTLTCSALESSAYDVAVESAPTQVVSMDMNIDPLCSSNDTITNVGVCKNGNTSFDSVIAKESDVAIAYALDSERTPCKIQKGAGMDTGTASGLDDDLNTLAKMTSIDICLPLEAVSLEAKPVIGAAEVDAPHTDSNCKGVHASGQSGVTEDAKSQVDIASLPHNAGVSSSVCVVSEEAMQNCSRNSITDRGNEGGPTSHEVHGRYDDNSPSSSLGNVNAEDSSAAVCDLEISRGGKDFIARDQNSEELLAGFDSQYEDGELRELDVLDSKENEESSGELEFVNCGSHNIEASDVDDVDHNMSEKVQVETGCKEERSFVHEAKNTEKIVEVQRGSSTGSESVVERSEHYTTADDVKEPSVSFETKSQLDISPGGHKSSEKLSVVITKGSMTRKITADCMDGLVDKNCPLKVDEPRISNKDSEFVQRGRSDNFDSCTHTEKDDATVNCIGRDKSASPAKFPRVGQLISPSSVHWDSKCCGSPSYFNSYGSRRPRPQSVVEGHGYLMTSSGGVLVARVEDRVGRPYIRRRLPSGREDAYGIRRGMEAVREASSDRRFRRYPIEFSRGAREEYHRPVRDDSREYSYHVPHHMARRERSISPPIRRRPLHYTQSYKKSQSRSRSRSPVGGWLPGEQSEGSSPHRSWSPDHRFEVGLERMRLPLQKPSFAADCEAEFMSPPRHCFSQQRNSRWYDDPISAVDHHFRGRRLAVSTFQQGQRFDPMHSPQRLDPEDYFEPVIRPGRFVDMDSAGRGCSEDDRRKHGDRYDIMHRERRFGKGGAVQRFRYSAGDCLVSQNSHKYDGCDKGIDTRLRDAPRRVVEDKGSLRYKRGRLYDSCSNSFGTQDA